jgi:hypothetical protein
MRCSHTHTLLQLASAAVAVVGPVPGPGPNSTTSIGLILTTEPQGPYALLPSGATNTSSPQPPDAVLLENCTLSSYDSTGKAVFSTPLPAGSDPVGPCQLIMDKNGTLYIRDLGNDGAVLWSNEVQTNRTAATCSPYSLAVLTNGMLVERDCANRTVWSVPQLAGKQGPRVANRRVNCAFHGRLLRCLFAAPQFRGNEYAPLAHDHRPIALLANQFAGLRRSCEPCDRTQHHYRQLHTHHRATGALCAAACGCSQRQQRDCTICSAGSQL